MSEDANDAALSASAIFDPSAGLSTDAAATDAAVGSGDADASPILEDATVAASGDADAPLADQDDTAAPVSLGDVTSNVHRIGSSTPHALLVARDQGSANEAWGTSSDAEAAPSTLPSSVLSALLAGVAPTAPDPLGSLGGTVDAGTPVSAGVPPVFVNGTGSDPVSDTADQVVQGDAARSTYDVDGTGIKIGIISDSFDSDGDAGADEADGALPPAADVHILQDASGTDEGRAMAEIAHSIAPGAQIYFYTAGGSDADMASAISALQSAGCQIIIDDVFFTDEPFYQEGVISAAVNSVVADGSTYFTAANNSSDAYYEGTFIPITEAIPHVGTVSANNFGTAANPVYELPVTIPEGLSTLIDLQWNQPFLTADDAASGPGSANSLAFALLNPSGTVVASGRARDVGGDPIQLTDFTSNSSTGTSFYLVIYRNQSAGPVPGQFKIILDNDSSEPPSLQGEGGGSGTVLGHEEDPNAITVGAAPESDPNVMENYSAYGPGEFLFNANGSPLAQPVTDGKINVVAPDGNSTSVPDLTSFYGTSAATPAAAAVGALMLEANPALDPSDVGNILEDTGTPIAGNPDQTGSGMVDALAAVGASETLTFDESASVATLLGTHLGATFVGGSGNHTLVGEGGVNTLDYEDAPAGVTLNFVTDTASNGFGGTDSFSDIQAAEGSVFADSFVAGSTGEALFGDGGADTLNFAALAAGGVLNLTGGSFSANTATSGGDAGTIDVQDACTLVISGGTLANTGLLEAQAGGDLDIACAMSGAGSTSVGNGAVLELGSTDSETVTFAGTPATLKLDAPSSFSGTIAGLALGDVLDLVDTIVTAAPIVGSTLSITLSGGATLSYQVAGALTGNDFALTSDGSKGTDLVLAASSGAGLAQAVINTASPIALGAARMGGTLSAALSITNGAAAPAEALDASIGSTTGSATGTGSISLLAAGATDTTDIAVGAGTSAAGPSTGSVTLAFASDGSNTDGHGKTALASQTVQVSGTVYREATASVRGLPATFIVHVGQTVAQALTIANSAANDGYSENLVATVAAGSGGVSGSGSTGDIAAQGSSSAITVGFSTAQAGTVSGSVTLGLASDGTGIDGFGPTSIGQQVVAVNATVDNYAVAALEDVSGGGVWSQNGTSYTLSLGTVALGAAPVTVGLGVLNNVAGPADLLSGSFAASGGSAFTLSGFGAFSGLGAGQADLAPSVTFSTGTAGSFSETITLDPTGSNAGGYAAALTAETLTITGTATGMLTWVGGSSLSGSWNNAADWSPAAVPGSQTTAKITAAGAYTVTSAQSNGVGALTLSDAGATLAVSAGQFSILGAAASTVAGTVAVSDAATLLLAGTVTDSGTIGLGSTGDATGLEISGTATLNGGGLVAMSDAAQNAILSNGAAASLANADTIAGSGEIGDTNLTLANKAAGVVDASGANNALVINTGANAVTNSGILEATGRGGLSVVGALVNGGALVASAGTLSVAGAVTGIGTATITGATLAFGSSVVANQAITFAQGSSGGTLALGLAQSFKGTVAGFAAGDTIDLADFQFPSAPTISKVAAITVGSSTGVAVTVKDAALTATIDLLNQFGAQMPTSAAGYALTSDGSKGTDLVLAASSGAGLAQAVINTASPIALGAARMGGTLSAALSITNGAAAPAEALDASIGSTTGSATGTGSISLLAAGATDTTDIAVGAGTSAAGPSTGSVTLAFASDGSNTDGHGKTALASQTVQVSGTVYREATASVRGLPATFIVHVGQTVAQALTIANSAANDGYSENLVATVAAGSGGVSGSGSTGDIAAQGSSSAITVGFSTAQAGTVSGSVTLGLASDGTGIDGFGPTSIGQQVVTVNATVDNYAVAALEDVSGGGVWSQNGSSYTLSLGTVALGAAPVTVGLGVLNNVAGPADLLSGSFAASGGSAFTLSGFGAFSGLGAGQADLAPSVTFSTGTAGSFSETITLDPTGSNAGGYAAALTAETLTITGTATGMLTWVGGSSLSGSWNNAADWSPAAVPGSQTTAKITAAGAYTVTSAQSNGVGALTLSDAGATLAVSAGQFSILGAAASTVAGTVAVSDAATLLLAGTVTDSGTIGLGSTGDATGLEISGTATLNGGGLVAMSDAAQNAILSNGAAASLANADTIAGSGEIGDTNLTLANKAAGVIDASGANNALVINTGANAVTNSGILEATGRGGLSVVGALVNGGALVASAGTLSVAGAVTGIGTATITGATLAFGSSVVANQAITFAQGSSGGTLALGLAQSFKGTVAGFAAGDTIDLADFQFPSAPTISKVAAITVGSSTGVAVTVKDAALTATIDLLNQFGAQMPTSAAGYMLTSDNAANGHPGTFLQLAPSV